jgi:hypothetical protein
MQNKTNLTYFDYSPEKKALEIVSSISLLIIFLGFVGNTITFLIFRLDEELKVMSSMIILSFCCVTDMLSLITWNLNHWLESNFNFRIEFLNIHTCKFFVFIQYFSLQSSGLLLSFVCVDRYFNVIAKPGSFVSKLPFGTVRSSLIWSFSIIGCIFLLNSYILFMDRSVIDENELDCYTLSNGYRIYPQWEIIHIVIYPSSAVLIMFIFNILLVKKIMNLRQNLSKIQSVLEKKRANRKINITKSLLFITCMFILMNLPGTIMFG